MLFYSLSSTIHRRLITVTTPDTDAPASAPAPRFPRLRAVFPYALTACIAVVVTLAILAAWPRPVPALVVSATSAPATSTPAPTALPTTPVPTAPPVSAGVARQEIADLHAEDNRLWTTVFLLKSVSQVAEAESMLKTNDAASVDQALIAADYSLSLAYDRAEESQKSPIDQFRRNVDRIRGDLYLYPERMDARLAQLRQLLLTLIDDTRA